MSGSTLEDILDSAERVLAKYPLCDHCLGRLFARLGRELGNDERGRALKTLLAMRFTLRGNEPAGERDREVLSTLARNAGEPFTRLYLKLHGQGVDAEKCYVCGGILSRSLFDELASRITGELKKLDASTFLIGVRLGEEVFERELEVLKLLGLNYSESIKNEIKREVGRRVASITGLQPSFTNPDVLAIVEFPSLNVSLDIKPVYLRGVYLKLGRNISHTPWITREGVKKYPLSIQEFLDAKLKGVFQAEKILIHAAGREDVDARMVGTGRPLVVEVVRPLKRRVEIGGLNKLLQSDVISVLVEDYAAPRDVRVVKEVVGRKAKVYKILVLLKGDVGDDRLEELENFFRNRVVTQRTPTRILRRKKDVARRRKVYAVKVVRLGRRVLEALVYCESGLYVKELVHCDGGRTNPCFPTVLGVGGQPLELDVLGFAEKPE
jgi:tRNA pseudouridine synthase 10